MSLTPTSLHCTNAVIRHALTHPPEDLAITVITVAEQLSGCDALLRQVAVSEQSSLGFTA
jgi:hypothetical protein